jgi:ribosomal protein S18 acetylase RimI-like enzyme
MNVIIGRANNDSDLIGIKNLQQLNLRKNLNESTASAQGFLTAEYTLEYLKAMNDASPSIIAKDGDRIAGYALVATKEVRNGHDLMSDLFNVIDTKSYKGQLLKEVNYVVVGQLCVAEAYRGQGLVKKMYDHFRDCLASEYEYLITDVAQANIRSLNAHKKSGFQVIDTLVYAGIGWDIVLWDWAKPISYSPDPTE